MGVYLLNAEMDLMRLQKHLRTCNHNLTEARRAGKKPQAKYWRKEVSRFQRRLATQSEKVEAERVKRQNEKAAFIAEVA